MSLVVKENKWEAWQESLFGRFLGLDLFDLSKITVLPETILSDLSWEPGENESFFSDGEFCGWPLRIWPIFERPFIKIDGKYYCFDLYSLFDNIYRAIQRLVTNKCPEYKEQWNIRQKEMSELIPFKLLNKILPEATIYRSNYYRMSLSPGGAKNWHENDGVLIYGDHLFIVEIKAGAFTYTPPATHFPDYLKSIENLILKPTEQGTKLLSYLKTDNTVAIYDENHQKKANLSLRDFKHITVCAITLDPITEIASQTEHLKKLNMELGDYPIWSVSIDDLRAYADIFKNPLVFLHYIEQRNRAQKSEAVKVNDELDHLGLYFAHNNYSQHAKESAFEGNLQWIGYRKNIDKFFARQIYQDQKGDPPRQRMPPRLRELIDILYGSKNITAKRVVSLLLDLGGQQRDNIAKAIDNVLSFQAESFRPKPFSIYGPVGITIFCWQNGVVARDQRQAVDHAMAVAFAGVESERLLLELQFDSKANIVSVDFQFVNLFSLSDSETRRIKEISKLLVDRRLAKAGHEGCGVGRNQHCPCGSGKKFKKCCMKRK